LSQMIIGSGNGGFMILYIVALFALLYFLMIRPQKKSQDRHKQMINNLKVNDRVLTVGGITGYVRDMNDSYLYIEIADGIVIELNRQYIAMVLQEEADDEEDLPVEDAEEIEEVAEIEAAEEAEAEKEAADEKKA
jgi:preprotein translocase subunit YajC